MQLFSFNTTIISFETIDITLICSGVVLDPLQPELLSRRGSKGIEIEFNALEISEYLLPFNSKLNIAEKRKLFEIRNRMIKLPYNFGKEEEKCVCGKKENISHIYECKSLNEQQAKLPYNKIYNGNLNNQLDIFRRLEKSLKERDKIKQIFSHVILVILWTVLSLDLDK